MLEPNYIANLANGAEETSADLHEEIIRQIITRLAARIGSGEEPFLTTTDRWQIGVLREAGYLESDIRKAIAQGTKDIRKEVKRAYEAAAFKQAEWDTKTYKAVGIDPTKDIRQSPTYLRILQAAYERTMAEWENFTGTTLVRAAYNEFIQQCNRAFMKVTTGGDSWTRAYMDAVNEIANQGVTVTYPSGHTDTIETATMRAVRTGVAQAAGKVTAVRAAENGVTLMLTSAHNGARPTHAPWQGKVFWVDWQELARRINITESVEFPIASAEEQAKYREFCRATDIGTVTGLEGANCRHSYGPFFEGMSNPYEDMDFDKKQYSIDQRQRELERRIRKTKRIIAGYDTAMEKITDQDAIESIKRARKIRVNTLTRQVDNYYDYCKEHELKPQEARIHIAK